MPPQLVLSLLPITPAFNQYLLSVDFSFSFNEGISCFCCWVFFLNGEPGGANSVFLKAGLSQLIQSECTGSVPVSVGPGQIMMRSTLIGSVGMTDGFDWLTLRRQGCISVQSVLSVFLYLFSHWWSYLFCFPASDLLYLSLCNLY